MIINLGKDEQIVLELRRHWFIFFLETIFLVIFVCLPFIIFAFLSQNNALEAHPILTNWFQFAAAAWFLFTWITFFIIWTTFYLDAWIITNERIIDIEQHALFKREIVEFRIENIQDVSIHVSGFIPTMLGYGDILAETAGEQRHCTIKDAPHPEKVKNLLSELQANLATNARP